MPEINHRPSLATKRKLRVRSKLHGTAERPRLTVFRSNKNTYLQVIDDVAAKTLCSASSPSVGKANAKESFTKMTAAVKAAEAIVTQLQAQKITAVVFDRGSYKYHGRVKAIAEALRDGKIQV
ncbi:MAG: 50S ribosomal protein L18 [bacterium]|nr:50S ribosomal protein L18 [bacterium]